MQDKTSPAGTAAILTVASMTGFARMAGSSPSMSWTWEARSVNHRGLDVRVRLPARLDTLEPRIRELLSKRVTRGSVTISLDLKRQAAAGTLAVNRDMLNRILDLQRELGPRIDQAPPRIEALLAIRGVLEAGG